MPGLRDVLARFRPSGAPGAASAVGVPADRRAGVAAELEPVFAALADVVAECADVRSRAMAASSQQIDEATERALAVLARARDATPGERAAAMSGARRRAESQLLETAAQAAQEAEQITQRADARMPRLVDVVIDRVRRDVASLGADDHPGERAAS